MQTDLEDMISDMQIRFRRSNEQSVSDLTHNDDLDDGTLSDGSARFGIGTEPRVNLQQIGANIMNINTNNNMRA